MVNENGLVVSSDEGTPEPAADSFGPVHRACSSIASAITFGIGASGGGLVNIPGTYFVRSINLPPTFSIRGNFPTTGFLEFRRCFFTGASSCFYCITLCSNVSRCLPFVAGQGAP